MHGRTGKRSENIYLPYIISSLIQPLLQTEKLGVEANLMDQAIQTTFLPMGKRKKEQMCSFTCQSLHSTLLTESTIKARSSVASSWILLKCSAPLQCLFIEPDSFSQSLVCLIQVNKNNQPFFFDRPCF